MGCPKPVPFWTVAWLTPGKDSSRLMIWWQGSPHSWALTTLRSLHGGGSDIIQDILSVSWQAPSVSFLPTCATIPISRVSLVLFCLLPRDSPFTAGWLTRVKETSRSHYIFGNEKVCVCVCVCIQIDACSCLPIYLPATCLFLPQTENLAGIISFFF